jgi:hypothetical protein
MDDNSLQRVSDLVVGLKTNGLGVLLCIQNVKFGSRLVATIVVLMFLNVQQIVLKLGGEYTSESPATDRLVDV